MAGGGLDEVAGGVGVRQAPGPDVGRGAGPAEKGCGGDGDVDQGGQRGLAAGLVERGAGRRAVEPGRAALVLFFFRLRVFIVVFVVGGGIGGVIVVGNVRGDRAVGFDGGVVVVAAGVVPGVTGVAVIGVGLGFDGWR